MTFRKDIQVLIFNILLCKNLLFFSQMFYNYETKKLSEKNKGGKIFIIMRVICTIF